MLRTILKIASIRKILFGKKVNFLFLFSGFFSFFYEHLFFKQHRCVTHLYGCFFMASEGFCFSPTIKEPFMFLYLPGIDLAGIDAEEKCTILMQSILTIL
jgi:hypothetical protein